MGLRQRFVRAAVRRSHALVVEVPGCWAARVAAERALARRGWSLALSPADADVLVVCGQPGARLAEAVDRVWDQLPGPRARVAVVGAEAEPALDRAAADLADESGQRADARDRRPVAEGGEDEDEMTPAGIPLAGGAEDRDGLEMDVLHAPLGPVLPHWPPGLVLHCVLHGDVVAEAEVELLEGTVPPCASAPPVVLAAAAVDGAAGLLTLAGWGDAAAAGYRVRDLFLDGSRERGLRELDALRGRVRRSRLLRWALSGLGVLDDDAVRAHGLPADARGDVRDRLLALLDRAATAEPGGPDSRGAGQVVLAVVPTLVTGLELAAVRLVVASLHPDTAAAVRERPAHA